MEYSLIEWVGAGKTSKSVTFKIVDQEKVKKFDRFTDRLIVTILHILAQAKQADPDGYYLPLTHNPSKTRDDIYVVRDGFNMLEPLFKLMVQKLFDEYAESTQRYSYR
jgi:hypothetical protein